MMKMKLWKFKFGISHWPWDFPGPILAASVFYVLLAVAGLVPLIIHVMWCIQLATEYADYWIPLVLLIAGLIVPPVGWVHGMSILSGFGGWL